MAEEIDNIERIVAAIFTAARLSNRTHGSTFDEYWKEYYECLDALIQNERTRATKSRAGESDD